jgi:hypothetical protein
VTSSLTFTDVRLGRETKATICSCLVITGSSDKAPLCLNRTMVPPVGLLHTRDFKNLDGGGTLTLAVVFQCFPGSIVPPITFQTWAVFVERNAGFF